jgi:hypothetical protein
MGDPVLHVTELTADKVEAVLGLRARDAVSGGQPSTRW